MTSDKPDLLKHSEIVKESQKIIRSSDIRPKERTSLLNSSTNNDKEHLYENIAYELKPVFSIKTETDVGGQYDRKKDHQRDEMILSEMSRNADQTMKVIFFYYKKIKLNINANLFI